MQIPYIDGIVKIRFGEYWKVCNLDAFESLMYAYGWEINLRKMQESYNRDLRSPVEISTPK